MKNVKYVALAILISLAKPVFASSKTFAADNEYIQYIGRFDLSSPASPRADWPGVRVRAKFTGSSIGLHIKDGVADYVIYIDGQLYPTLKTKQGVTFYPIADGLEGANHTIDVIRKNEVHDNAMQFLGVELEQGASLLPPPARSDRKIEFIGASYTAGYGNESFSRTCTPEELMSTTNIDKAFGSIVAKYFNAEAHFEAWAGKGIVRNYGSIGTTDPDAFMAYFPRTLTSEKTSRWDMGSWHANYVVIQLGGNDFSTKPRAEEQRFISAYNALLNRLFNVYPDVKIILITTSIGIEQRYKQKIIKHQEAIPERKGRIAHVMLPNNLAKTGCNWHPSTHDHQIIAKLLIDKILKFGEWTPN